MTKFVVMAALLACSSSAFAGVHRGMIITKDDPNAAQKALEELHKSIGDVSTMLTKAQADAEQKFKDLSTHYSGVKADTDEIKKAAEEHTKSYAETVALTQRLKTELDQLRKELDSPAYRTGKDSKDEKTECAIQLQRRVHLWKGGAEEDFKEDRDNLVNIDDYRSAVRKMMRGGLESKAQIVKGFSEAERKAFDAASLDTAFFSPEILGIEVDCNTECAELLDLYASITVSRSKFMYPQVVDYGAIGSYDCDAKCDAELGPEGNIKYDNGRTFDFRGVFCFQRKVLEEANYNFLEFMMRSAARSHRINRNRALITGDGVNEPLGWLTGDCFTKLKTAALKFNHVDFRRFLASAPVEYGEVVATMHQNMFAYLASAVDNNGRFIFGDGQITFSPDDARERIRISNCLPDATANGTKGNAGAPFVAGDFLAAAGNWKTAYAQVNKRAMWMEQYIGGSSAWCVKYQFGAEDGGFAMCCPAARTLVVGA